MKIKKPSIAGTLESSDAMIQIFPDQKLIIEIESPVKAQFGEKIRETVNAVLRDHAIDQGKILIQDQGALDCTIEARLKTALNRSFAKGEEK